MTKEQVYCPECDKITDHVIFEKDLQAGKMTYARCKNKNKNGKVCNKVIKK